MGEEAVHSRTPVTTTSFSDAVKNTEMCATSTCLDMDSPSSDNREPTVLQKSDTFNLMSHVNVD